MSQLVEIHASDELPGLNSGHVTPLAKESFALEAPDAHWVLLDGHDILVARCSLWWKHAPRHTAQRLGVIGHYAAADAPSANSLLKHACAQLGKRGCAMAVAPMDGNTWRRYRFITERGSEPLFFLEPDNPDDWPQHFVAAGFSPLATYTSALNSDLDRSDMRGASKTDRVAEAGISLRHVDPAKMEEELRCVYRMSLASFQQNFLYTPLAEVEFLAQYRKIFPFVRPELVLIAERDEQPVGFLFAFPDILRPKRKEPEDTIIIKTIAVLPHFSSLGLGGLLVDRAQQNARDLGFKRAIHALMHESNRSRKISHHTAVTMRRYTLFSRLLSP